MATSVLAAASGSAVVKCAPATILSSRAALEASDETVEQLAAFHLPGNTTFKSHKRAVIRATHKPEEESSGIKTKVLVALVAAGVSLTLNAAAPIWSAQAGILFGGDVKVERGASAPELPGNEGVGTKVGDNSRVRGSANAGTPLGEAAGGDLVGNNQATRQASSRGTPLGEGRSNGTVENPKTPLRVRKTWPVMWPARRVPRRRRTLWVILQRAQRKVL